MRADPDEAARARAVAQRIVDGGLDARDVIFAPPPTVRAVEEGWLARAILEAEDHFARFALERASDTLTGARARLDREGPRGAEPAQIVELFLLTARIAEAQGDGLGATAAVRAALTVDPALVVDPERHPPTITALVERERGSGSTCPWTLTFDPPEAIVSVDGAPAAPGPAELPCGEHWLEIEAPGYRSSNLHQVLEPHAPPRMVELAIDPGAALRALGAPFEAPSPSAERAARGLGRSLLYLDVARDDGALSVALGALRVRAPLDATPDELLALLRAAGRTGSDLDVPLWVGVGVGATLAIATVITVLAVVLSPPPPSAFELRGQILP